MQSYIKYYKENWIHRSISLHPFLSRLIYVTTKKTSFLAFLRVSYHTKHFFHFIYHHFDIPRQFFFWQHKRDHSPLNLAKAPQVTTRKNKRDKMSVNMYLHVPLPA